METFCETVAQYHNEDTDEIKIYFIKTEVSHVTFYIHTCFPPSFIPSLAPGYNESILYL